MATCAATSFGSSLMPGPCVDDTVIDFMYVPFADAATGGGQVAPAVYDGGMDYLTVRCEVTSLASILMPGPIVVETVIDFM